MSNFCLKQGQGLKSSAAQLYPDFPWVCTPPHPDWGSPTGFFDPSFRPLFSLNPPSPPSDYFRHSGAFHAYSRPSLYHARFRKSVMTAWNLWSITHHTAQPTQTRGGVTQLLSDLRLRSQQRQRRYGPRTLSQDIAGRNKETHWVSHDIKRHHRSFTRYHTVSQGLT